VSQQTSDAAREVPIRRMSFEDSLATIPKHFARNNLFVSHLWANLSSVFPEGEAFFVRSVRRFRDQITDTALQQQVIGFSAQEGQHARAHRLLNERLAELGYPTKRIERMTRRALTTMERLLSPLSCLARTAALEHFTASLAERMLTDPEFRAEVGDTVVTDLVLWHALEEAEHKAVAFDVFRAVGGSERKRIWTMKFIRYGFAIGTAIGTLLSLLRDRAAYRDGNLRRSWREFRRSPFLSGALWAQLKEYERKGFHPDDRDTSALVEEWRERLFGSEGTLNDRLARSAA
jgi:predicted metal-dependent hydrolase